MSIYDFELRFREVDKMPSKPNWHYPNDGYIFDEDKSVKWNREECAFKQRMWKEERANLQNQIFLAKCKIEKDLISFISDEVDCTESAAKVIWERSDHDLNKCECLMDDYIAIRQEDH